MAIVRVKHDKNNPYVMLNKRSLWDETLSLEAVGLWSRLISRPDDWQVSATEIARSSKISVRRVYRILNELIENGYACRKQLMPKGKKGFDKVEYEIYEFKISLTHVDLTHSVGTRDAVCHATKEQVNQPLPKGNLKKNTVVPPVGKTSEDSFSEEGMNIAKDLWNRILKVHPKHKEPNLPSWAKTIDSCHRIDKRSWQDLKDIISYIFEADAFWVNTIQSADGLRKHFDKIWIKMRPASNAGSRIQENIKKASQVKSLLSQSNEAHLLIIQKTGVARQSGDSIPYDLPTETFENVLMNWFDLRK